MKMDTDVENIDKCDNKTWRKIYETIDEAYFGSIEVFPKEFLEHCKKIQMRHKIFHIKLKIK